MTRPLLVLAIASLFLASTAAVATPQGVTSAASHWALGWGRYDEAPTLDDAHGAIACLLGDVDADGTDDVLLRLEDEADAKLVAVSGADAATLWESALDEGALLECAPDAAGDGVADPLVTLEEASGAAIPSDGAPVSSEGVTQHLQAIDGGTGDTLLSLDAAESATSGDATSVSGSSRTDVTLQPGAQSLYLLVSREETSAVTEVLEGLPLSSEDSSLEIKILDAAGNVQGTIETAAQEDVLGHAIVTNGEVASVLVLTAADASVVDQAPAQIPTLTSYDAEGVAQWSAELAPTTQDLMLVPHAGDIDADGIEDIIVETRPSGIDLPSASTLSVLSGANGEILIERAADTGLLAALPLGDPTPLIPDDADALLIVTQAAGDAPVMLECVHADVTCWTAELPADAEPVNALTNDFTGDIEGFHDLTGDGVPDVATLVDGTDAGTLSVLNGVDGSVAWSTAIEAGSRVGPVPSADVVDLAVLGPFEEKARELAVSMIDGMDGSVAWTATAQVSNALGDAHAHLESAYDGRTLLLTIGEEHAYAIDAATGETLWSGAATAGAEAPGALELANAGGVNGIAALPTPGVVLAVAALGILALVRRRSG